MALVKFLAPPFLALPSGVLSWLNVAGVEEGSLAMVSAVVRTNGLPLVNQPSYGLPLDPMTSGVDRSAGHARAGAEDARAGETAPANSGGTDSTGGGFFDLGRRPRLTWQAALMFLHGLGMVVIGGCVVRQFQRVRRVVSGADEVHQGPLHETFCELVKELGVRRQVRANQR